MNFFKFVHWLLFTTVIISGAVVKAEIVPASVFCQRIQVDRVDGLCRQASSVWTDKLANFENYATPVTFTTTTNSVRAFKVLILSPKWSGAYDIATETIMREFAREGINVSYTLFNFLDNHEQASAIIEVAETQSVDLIFAAGSRAAQFITKYYRGGKLPVVTVCNKDPVSMGLVDADIGMSLSNIAYTSLNIDVSTQITYFKEKFITGLSRIAVIYDINNPSSIETQVKPLQEYLQKNDVGIELTLIEVDSYTVEGLDQMMASFIDGSTTTGDSIFLVTGSTELYDDIDKINRYAKNIPVLSVTPSHVTTGEDSVFMAIGVSFKNNAKLAANMGYRILTGKAQTQTLPVGVVQTPDISINFLHKTDKNLKVPFGFFEDAVVIYDYSGNPVRLNGMKVKDHEG